MHHCNPSWCYDSRPSCPDQFLNNIPVYHISRIVSSSDMDLGVLFNPKESKDNNMQKLELKKRFPWSPEL